MGATTTSAVTVLLAELTRRGIELQAHGDVLRYRPRTALTPDLLKRVQAHKPELLAILTTDDPAAEHYTAQERRLLADAPPDVKSTIAQIKTLFPGAEVVSVRPPVAHVVPDDDVRWFVAENGQEPRRMRTPLDDLDEDQMRSEPPRVVVQLAQERDGWTPGAWRGRLLQLADRCQEVVPDRATELRWAAILMTPAWHEAFDERAGILEFDGGLARPEAEAAAITDTLQQMNAVKRSGDN